jgi:hypothetical protein
VLETGENPHSLNLGRTAVDSCLAELLCVFLVQPGDQRMAARPVQSGTHHERIHVIRKDDNLVAAPFMVVDQELTSLELVWVHDVQQDPLATGFPEVFPVELGRHGTPYFRALKAQDKPS